MAFPSDRLLGKYGAGAYQCACSQPVTRKVGKIHQIPVKTEGHTTAVHSVVLGQERKGVYDLNPGNPG